MASSSIAGFPYSLLVRAPLGSLALLAAVMLSGVPEWPFARSARILFAVASYVGVLATGLLQFYAVPRGFWLLWEAPGNPSQLHKAALLCGTLHCVLALFLLWRASWVS